MILLKQGYPKKQFTLKEGPIARQTENLINSNPWNLPVPPNAHYRNEEMQYYFGIITLFSMSGEHAKRFCWKSLRVNLPDQQTVRVRVEKLSCLDIQTNNNNFSLTGQSLPGLEFPRFQKRKLDKMMKQEKYQQEVRNKDTKQNRSRRRQLRKSRKLQREREVERPEGNYLAMDEHNDPYYGVEDVLLDNGESMASYLVKDRQKQSTKTFFQYLTMYSFELGIRRVLGFHLVRRNKEGENWCKEPYGPIVKQLLEPIMDHYPITGVVGDGRYYDGGVIIFLLESELDFVIRADFSVTRKEWARNQDVLHNFEDGSGTWLEGGISFKPRGMKGMKLKFCVVKRGDEFVPLVVPLYSKLTPEQALMLYEERFGIETKYRELERRYGKTTSISPQYRVALFASSVNIFNQLMHYLETVVTPSLNPKHWKVTLLDIADQQKYNLQDIGIHVGEFGYLANYIQSFT